MHPSVAVASGIAVFWMSLGSCAELDPRRDRPYVGAPDLHAANNPSGAHPARKHYVTMFYPNTQQPFAEGELVGSTHVNEWRYYHRNGRMFARGNYDQAGKFAGAWLMWTPNGVLSEARRRWTCSDGALVASPPGFEELSLDEHGDSEERSLFRASPCYSPLWNGTGKYEDGVWRTATLD